MIALEQDYFRRIGRFLPCEMQSIPDLKKSDRRNLAAQLKREEESAMGKLSAGSYLVVLDEHGSELSSRELAGFLEKLMNRSIPEVVFIGGGHVGLSQSMLNRADHRLCLSRMTLPHELARVVLLEQVYRALTIWKGMPYHR